MADAKLDLLQGTLDNMVLQTLESDRDLMTRRTTDVDLVIALRHE